nr:MAG TPA: hypothetical protein [Caudoviricetes sp.]
MIIKIYHSFSLVKKEGDYPSLKYLIARSIFILPTSQNRHSSHRSVNFYFTDESEPSLVSYLR